MEGPVERSSLGLRYCTTKPTIGTMQLLCGALLVSCRAFRESGGPAICKISLSSSYLVCKYILHRYVSIGIPSMVIYPIGDYV